jgi:hypothetical protein
MVCKADATLKALASVSRCRRYAERGRRSAKRFAINWSAFAINRAVNACGVQPRFAT